MTNRLYALMAKKQMEENRPITISIVAREMGLDRQYVHKWFKDNLQSYRKDMIDAFCNYFNCEPGELIIRSKEQVQPAGEPEPG